tara:strand:- start:457 stop:618 length:162 start_codon:yes stop_codon:yes gene_type:complete
MPPKTELKVHIKAYHHALILLAKIIGINIISGGIGKTELSINEINDKNQEALL